MDETVHFLEVLGRDPLGQVEPAVLARAGGHLPSDLGGQVLRVEGLDRADAALAGDEPLPDRLDADAERAGDAHAGHDDAPHLGHSCDPSAAPLAQAAFCFSM